MKDLNGAELLSLTGDQAQGQAQGHPQPARGGHGHHGGQAAAQGSHAEEGQLR